ncbi:MAG: response regulator, partial [Comamonas sp.]|nr:response regulator [Comamonas sp.]
HNRSADPHGQPIDSLQRHALALLANHEQSLQHRQNSQSAMTELQSSLKGLRQLIQDCHVWADTLMLHGGLDMAEQTYEWHAEISDLVRYMLDATDDIGTIHRQLQHHQQEQQRSLQQHSGHLRALQHSLLYAKQRPFSSIAQRLQECLELAAQDCGKAAQLHISGGQLRLHKTTLQALVNALEHLLRNSLAHGIEPSRQRLAIGKPEQGQIQLRLSQQGSEQTIIVQDDGAGLNLAAIGQRARAQGMWHSERPPNAQEAAALVLQPGLSTAAALTAVAGRGIGLDAVQAQIQALGGRLRLQSKSGTGCRFTITLPAPPQVEQIIALRAGNWRVGIPAHYVQGQRSIAHDVLTSALEQGILRVDAGGPLPLYWAGALWQQSQHSQERAIEGQSNLLLLRSPTQRWGIVVDEVLSTQEVVLQAPGGLQTPIAGLLGTAIQPTGQVLQVYDPEAVIAAHEQRLRKGEPFQFQPNAATAAGQGQGQAADGADESSAAPRPLIMLVDDSISVRRLAQHLLASHGWRVVTAANGLEALGLLETGLLPVLLLVDIEMPDMNGLELLRRLREHPLWQGLPVVMLTAHEAGPVSQKALDSGAQAYLTKPYSPPQLLAQVARYAALAPQAPEAPEPVEAPAKRQK